MTAMHAGATVLGLTVLMALLPRRRATVRRPAEVSAALLAFAGFAMALALAGAALALWPLVSVAVLLGVAAVLLSFLVARAAGDDEDDEDGGGGGGGPPKRDPDPPRPGTPDGPRVDWSDFDAQRDQWASRSDRDTIDA